MEAVLEPVGTAGRGIYFGIGGGSRDISRPLSFLGRENLPYEIKRLLHMPDAFHLRYFGWGFLQITGDQSNETGCIKCDC